MPVDPLAAGAAAGPAPRSCTPGVASGRDGPLRWWQVGVDRVELFPAPAGWSARVRRAGWDGMPLEVDGQFAGEAEALAWCERMAGALGRDHEGDD